MIIHTVRAELVERYIFNYRMPIDAMAAILPVSWLQPQIVNGYAVASFCALDLRHIVPAPLCPVAGPSSISSAPRYAVINMSGDEPEPAVFLTRRFTNSRIGSWITACTCIAPHPHAPAVIRHGVGAVEVSIKGTDSAFYGKACTDPAWSGSALFGSVGEFASLIAVGKTSYGYCNRPHHLTHIDLKKTDGIYEPLSVSDVCSPTISVWEKYGAEFDSAFRTCGGVYEWTYQGLVEV